jgi:Na+-translocating ferredoxin:NAD+ oxidoreductase subunit B
MPELVARILAALPQTQCTRCGYPDCAGYAQAIATQQAPINQCPPGGAQGIERLAAILEQSGPPPPGPGFTLNPAFGVEGPLTVAVIDETWCIGCTLCINACPTDAIVGTHKLMHTVIEAYCTGCELCLPVCPVDCIALENVSGSATAWAAWPQVLADQARSRYEFSSTRRKLDGGQTDKKPEKKTVIAAALARARAKALAGSVKA